MSVVTRVSNQILFNSLVTNAGRNIVEVNRLQEQVSNQRRVNNPSDDPTAVAKSSSATTGIPASVTSSADAELFGDAGCCSQAADGANPLAAESRVPGAWPDEGAAAATVAGLLRHTAGAVTVLLLWPLLVEPLLGNLPGRGPQIGPYLPFANVFEFLDVQWLFPSYAMHWGPAASLGYFLTVVAAVFVTAVVAVNRRDA